MARRQIALLPLASVGRVLVRSSRQLSPEDAARAPDRTVVLSRGPPNVQLIAGLPGRQAAEPSRVDRGERHGRISGQERGGRRGCAAWARRHLAQRCPLAASAHPRGPNCPYACIDGGGYRRVRQQANPRDRSPRRIHAALPSPVALATDVEQYSAAVRLQRGIGCRTATGQQRPTKGGS
jgi:hypothetical protein